MAAKKTYLPFLGLRLSGGRGLFSINYQLCRINVKFFLNFVQVETLSFDEPG